jgi:hypothetical protein
MNVNNFKFFLFSFFTLILNITSAQTIKGTVKDLEGKSLNAKILIKKPDSTNNISEFVLVNKGVFFYPLKKKYTFENIFLEVSAIGYSTYEEQVEFSKLKNTLVFNFVLLKEKIEKLDEIIIKSKKLPFSIKKDTVTYQVSSYLDGTERKVVDLLKKLPGIKVDENSNIIKYKGKQIETVTIDGDNLFDQNYSIGTKNINIDLVKEIEAIENYTENELLKGIENSDKVSLNLKLKESKTDFSLNTELGIGHFSDAKETLIDASVNLLAINKKHKSFSVSTYNNIGKNKSSFNYSNNQISLEQLRESNYLTDKTINSFGLPNVTENNLSNINNEFFSNLNSIYTLSDKIKAKVNLYYITDRITSNQFSESNFNIGNNSFSTFDNNFIRKKPLQYRGDLELKYNITKSSLLKYEIRFSDEFIDTESTIFSNQNKDFSSFLQSNSTFIKQNIEYTKKISDKKAFQFNLLNTQNNLNQNLSINPSIFNSPNFNQDVQNIDSKNQNTTFKALFLGRKENGNKYSFASGFRLNKELFVSDLFSKNSIDSISIENSKNNLEYSKNEIYSYGSYNMKINKFTISPNYSFRYLMQNTTIANSDIFLFEPSLNIVYKIDRTSIISFDLGLNKNTSSIQNLYERHILIDNRLVKRNRFNLSLQKNQNYNLTFSKNDLFNQLEISFSANYLKQKGNFFANTLINENSTEITNFYLNEDTENIYFNLSVSKLIPFLKTNFKIISNYSVYNFKNIINNSELRNNKAIASTNSLFLKTAFSWLLNFENKTTYSFQENRSTNLFFNESLENKFDFIFKPSKKIIGTFTYNYLIPSFTNNSNNYSFLNTKLLYKPQNTKWQLELSGVNLLNEKFFTQENTTDISTDTFRINLIGRYYLLNFSYSF